jgi:hypothetical protein
LATDSAIPEIKHVMFQANQRIIEFLFWLRNLWSHLAWFTWLKIMIPTKNSIFNF